MWRRISANLGLEIPPASGSAGCPLCECDQWYTVLEGDGFRIEKCELGCIRRTVPPPAYSPELPPGASVENLTRDVWESGHQKFAEQIMDVVESHWTSGRLLDVGSGFGHLLRLALGRGYDAIGIEASPEAARLSKAAFGADPIVGFFPEHKFDMCSFEVVVMNHVLEHMPDPESAVREAARILKPGGILVIMYPNFNSLMRWIKSAGWAGLQPSQHLWQLSTGTVRNLMDFAGLEPYHTYSGSLDYHRGPRPLWKWMIWRLVLRAADWLDLGDNMISVGLKPVWQVRVKGLQ